MKICRPVQDQFRATAVFCFVVILPVIDDHGSHEIFMMHQFIPQELGFSDKNACTTLLST
jgi:hypothetical protein